VLRSLEHETYRLSQISRIEFTDSGIRTVRPSLAWHPVEQTSVCSSGRDDSDTHASACQLNTQRIAESFDRTLGASIDTTARCRHCGTDARDVDDVPIALLYHDAGEQIAVAHHCAEVERDHAFERIQVDVGDRSVTKNASVVNQRVDPAKAIERVREQALGCRPFRYVAGNDSNLVTKLGANAGKFLVR